MVVLNTTGRGAIDPPPLVKVSLDQLEELHEKACRYDELMPQLSTLIENDAIKDSLIVVQKQSITLMNEEKSSLKENNKEKEKEIKHLKKGITLRNIAIGVITVFAMIISVK